MTIIQRELAILAQIIYLQCREFRFTSHPTEEVSRWKRVVCRLQSLLYDAWQQKNPIRCKVLETVTTSSHMDAVRTKASYIWILQQDASTTPEFFRYTNTTFFETITNIITTLTDPTVCHYDGTWLYSYPEFCKQFRKPLQWDATDVTTLDAEHLWDEKQWLFFLQQIQSEEEIPGSIGEDTEWISFDDAIERVLDGTDMVNDLGITMTYHPVPNEMLPTEIQSILVKEPRNMEEHTITLEELDIFKELRWRER